VQAQAVLRESLRQHLLDPPRVVLVLEADDEVICVADEERLAAHARQDIPHPPPVEHFMQVDVRQQWG